MPLPGEPSSGLEAEEFGDFGWVGGEPKLKPPRLLPEELIFGEETVGEFLAKVLTAELVGPPKLKASRWGSCLGDKVAGEVGADPVPPNVFDMVDPKLKPDP